MFWFCKPKPITVWFYTTREDVFNLAKPERAGKHIPSWVKKLPDRSFREEESALLLKESNLKTCPGFANLYKSGVMLTMWSDLNVQVYPDGRIKYQFADFLSTAEIHSAKQMNGFELCNSYAHLKIKNPWIMGADKNIDMLFMSPTWNGFGCDEIIVAPGVYDPKICQDHANVNLFFKKRETSVVYELLFGQPVTHVVPLTDKKVIYKHALVTESELKKIKAKAPIFLMHDLRYKRAERLCPHAD